MQYDILIIGAGAAGLMCGYKLSAAGFAVGILEARDRTGGRIHTLRGHGFTDFAEGGAEFMHGELPLTSGVLKEHRILYHSIKGTSWKVKDGKADWGYFFEGGWEKLVETLGTLKEDMPLADFLTKYFPDEKFQPLKDSVKGFVEGYDAADINKVSSLALSEEWSGHDDSQQFRVGGGYSCMTERLAREVVRHKGEIHLLQEVTEISWTSGSLKAITSQGRVYSARKVIVTLPIGVLRSGAVKFTPVIPAYTQAFSQIGYGGVIKFLLEFHTPFWLDKDPFPCRKMPLLHFLFSDALIPTWWTQLPKQNALLTGWLGGPSASEFSGKDDDTLIEKALDSLAYLFNCEKSRLKDHLRTTSVVNWITDPFAQGAYAYTTLETAAAKKVLTEPVSGTVFFCGEALYDGPEMGTVEAALASGFSLAEKIFSVT